MHWVTDGGKTDDVRVVMRAEVECGGSGGGAMVELGYAGSKGVVGCVDGKVGGGGAGGHGGCSWTGGDAERESAMVRDDGGLKGCGGTSICIRILHAG